jgi:thiol-disulfide isomerase/thioredoxin
MMWPRRGITHQMRRVVASALLVVASWACRREEPQPREHVDRGSNGSAAVAAPATTPRDACPPAEREGGAMAWIRDDYAGALACARARHQPLVLDLWAPWCHTCLSMQTTVFTDPSFAADASRFVFASLDTDRDGNVAAVAKFPLSAWPTFYVVGGDEQVLARFVGGASLAQFHAFLDDGARVAAGSAAGSADVHLLAADRAFAGSDYASAERELTAALAAGSASWPRRADAYVSLAMATAKAGDPAGCLTLGEQAIDKTGNAAAASDFLVVTLGCATARKAAEPARAAAFRDRAIARWRALIADAASPMSIDDRSDAMASLREALDDAGRHDDARAVAEHQRAMLDDAAAKAPNPFAAMTYNWHRAEVYTYLGRGLDIVAALEKSAKDLPDEYDPLARLGWVYLKAEQWADAASWMDKALAKMYGPRKARYLGLRADIAKGAGDKDGEAKFRAEQAKLEADLGGRTK